MSDLPPAVRDALQNAQNVTGAEVVPPTDLDGYLDEPQMKFGFWVGPSDDDDADLVTFELNGDQIQDIADAFQQAADHAADLGDQAATDGGKPRDARPDLVHDQAELLDQADDADAEADRDDPDADADRKTMDVDCHACGTALSPNTGLGGNGYRLRSGVCPTCRLDGVGSTTVVELDDQVADVVQKKLARAQRRASAQSTYSAAVFLDGQVPAGYYEVRRVSDFTVQVVLPDDMDQTARMELTERYRDADVWFVQSFPDRINLVDRNFGSTDQTDAELVQTYAGP